MMMDMDKMMGDGMMMDGDMMMGDGDMMMEGGMEFFNKEGFGESAGPELLPKLLVEALALHPYVGDLVRA